MGTIKQSTINSIAADIIHDFFNNQDVDAAMCEIASELVDGIVPWTGGKNGQVDDLHSEVGGMVTTKLAEYIKLGYKYSTKCNDDYVVN